MARKKNKKKNIETPIIPNDSDKKTSTDNMSVDELIATIQAEEQNSENSVQDSFEIEEIQETEEIQEIPEEEISNPADSMIESIRQNATEIMSDMDSSSEYAEIPQENPDSSISDMSENIIPETSDSIFPEQDITEENSEILPEINEDFSGVLDENPSEVVKKEISVPDSQADDDPSKGMGKRTLYAAIGVMFAVFTCIGISSALTKATGYFGSFTVNEVQMESFKSAVYPAVIMDMPAFTNTYELTSEQVLTAAIWSMIMTDGVLDGYQKTFDVVSVPAVDVEAYAVKLFGEDIPALTHSTVGPAEARFYYNSEAKSYNIPAKPLVYTYYPRIKSVSKVDEVYSVMVDYVNELPEWLESVSSKQVEFKLRESNGGYIITSLRVVTSSPSL
ncbi:MAG: hypothetical protein IKS03_05285 [Ruminococcus sp.]|nr:hypothetical protein [Ruminococcus sp.]